MLLNSLLSSAIVLELQGSIATRGRRPATSSAKPRRQTHEVDPGRARELRERLQTRLRPHLVPARRIQGPWQLLRGLNTGVFQARPRTRRPSPPPKTTGAGGENEETSRQHCPCRLTDLELSGAPQLATREADRARPTRPLERLVRRQVAIVPYEKRYLASQLLAPLCSSEQPLDCDN